MRALVQRVSQAHVSVDGKIIGSIKGGFVVLLGVTHDDSERQVEWMANKIAGLRVFDDAEGKMNLSIMDVRGSILLVSQFTLYGNADKGRRPSFTAAALPAHAEPLIALLAERMKEKGVVVATGIFGAKMAVSLINDGPVTLMLER